MCHIDWLPPVTKFTTGKYWALGKKRSIARDKENPEKTAKRTRKKKAGEKWPKQMGKPNKNRLPNRKLEQCCISHKNARWAVLISRRWTPPNHSQLKRDKRPRSRINHDKYDFEITICASSSTDYYNCYLFPCISFRIVLARTEPILSPFSFNFNELFTEFCSNCVCSESFLRFSLGKKKCGILFHRTRFHRVLPQMFYFSKMFVCGWLWVLLAFATLLTSFLW